MSKLNSTKKMTDLNESQTMVGEVAGCVTDTAAAQTSLQLLRRIVLANLLWENIAYIDGLSVTNEIDRLIPMCNPSDVASLAIEARVVQKLRHIPLYIIVQMCKHDNMRKLVKDVIPMVVTRPDMLTDLMALYWKDGKCPICNAMKKGLAQAFHNFNEYQFAKYDRNAPIKLRDVMFMVRPKPETEEEKELFNKIANRTLGTPDTWEVLLTNAHTNEEKAAVWRKLIDENKLGGMATLMNLNNMTKCELERPYIIKALSQLKSNMLLPLQFLKAARMAPDFEREIEYVMVKSYANLPKLPGKTLFVVDVSGSMTCTVSGNSMFNRMDVAAAMAMLAANQCEDFELVLTAGSDYRREEAHHFIKYPPKSFNMFKAIKDQYNKLGSGGIFTYQLFQNLRTELGDKIHSYDRVIVFSDSQDVDVARGSNKKPKPFGKKNYICDVSCHTNGIAYDGVWTAEISGWSEHFLTFIAAYEGIENTFEN